MELAVKDDVRGAREIVLRLDAFEFAFFARRPIVKFDFAVTVTYG